MKTVFNNSQLCHVWANQTQEHGRSGSMLFEGKDIFSYGRHYLAARIYTRGGRTFALVNSRRYSATTGGHLSEVRHSLHQLMEYFCVPDPSDLKGASKYLDEQAQASTLSPLKRMKITDEDGVRWEFENIKRAFDAANQLRRILKRPDKFATKKQLNEVEKHLRKRLARYKELNTPEIIQARAEQKARDEQAANAARVAQLAEQVEKFRAGAVNEVWGLPYEALRIQSDIVKTSRGAEVPLKAAIALYRAIKAERDVIGQTIGEFTVNGVTPIDGDKLLTIGCHRILLSEAARVLNLQVVAA